MSSQLLFVGVAGFAAAMVDGVLGMGFGPTSSTILLGAGLSPSAASTTVNIAKVFTGAAGGAAHWKLGNIDPKLVLRLAIPGVAGAVVGVTVLANVDGDTLKPYLAAMLLVVGLRILVRFGKGARSAPDQGAEAVAAGYSTRGISVAGFAGGITNGLVGAWGPVVTPVLLNRDGLEPRKSIGSVNVAEIAVATAAIGSLLASLGKGGIEVGYLVAMLVGGVLAAPCAALFTKFLNPRSLGIGAGMLLLFTNVRELSGTFDLAETRWIGYALVLAMGVAAALFPRLATRRQALSPVGAAA